MAPPVMLGVVGMLMPPSGVQGPEDARRAYLIFFLVVFIASMVILPLLFYFIRRHLILPVQRLSQRAGDFGAGRSPLNGESFRVEEIHRLGRSINDMMQAVLEREDQLLALNESLEEKVRERTEAHVQTIQALRNTRNQLLLSEKMAALGALVSGVAHEINTPMSIGVTAASFLNERTRSIRDDLEQQSMTPEALQRFLDDADESSRIIQSNLDQASRIINSLKRVAADQQTEEKREFELSSYLNDIVLSLKHQLKPGRHSIQVEATGALVMKTIPGAVNQIINNLVFNSITHGFDGIKDGIITIACQDFQDEVKIIYSDNGRGLTPEERSRLYDKFYTTRPGRGGTGLGMDIVRRLTEKQLQGRIELFKPDQGGVGFILTIPKQIETSSIGGGEWEHANASES
ncbi:MAG: HAMP domain-containing histidine kinase [Spirochaetales bacterium]|nr:HAMP domain-containing histidine kinase [Spirochaetales bacterium]